MLNPQMDTQDWSQPVEIMCADNFLEPTTPHMHHHSKCIIGVRQAPCCLWMVPGVRMQETQALLHKGWGLDRLKPWVSLMLLFALSLHCCKSLSSWNPIFLPCTEGLWQKPFQSSQLHTDTRANRASRLLKHIPEHSTLRSMLFFPKKFLFCLLLCAF